MTKLLLGRISIYIETFLVQIFHELWNCPESLRIKNSDQKQFHYKLQSGLKSNFVMWREENDGFFWVEIQTKMVAHVKRRLASSLDKKRHLRMKILLIFL